jgi:hypothetical protein
MSIKSLSLLIRCSPRRVLQCGLNSGGNDCLFIGGMELYGTLTEKNV